ncbi:hypothetical protein [Nocardia sputorum]|nr:hypothetical protein [Nocardia sputorum]
MVTVASILSTCVPKPGRLPRQARDTGRHGAPVQQQAQHAPHEQPIHQSVDHRVAQKQQAARTDQRDEARAQARRSFPEQMTPADLPPAKLSAANDTVAGCS